MAKYGPKTIVMETVPRLDLVYTLLINRILTPLV